MPEDPLQDLRVQHLAGNGCALASSQIGSKVEALKMLKLADEQKIKPWVEVMPMSK